MSGHNYSIEMASTEFGVEKFGYDSKKEALAGFKRLKKSCRKEFKKDGIVRTLSLGRLGESVTIS